jgi:hypothetical protein
MTIPKARIDQIANHDRRSLCPSADPIPGECANSREECLPGQRRQERANGEQDSFGSRQIVEFTELVSNR